MQDLSIRLLHPGDLSEVAIYPNGRVLQFHPWYGERGEWRVYAEAGGDPAVRVAQLLEVGYIPEPEGNVRLSEAEDE